jgi:DNA-binding transcriptional MerR regulator
LHADINIHYRPMTNPIENLENWTGDIFELEQTSQKVLESLGLGHLPAPNIRLIRDYAQRGILSPPERQGKLGLYRAQHLKELVAARILVNEGVPLTKIAEQFEADRDIVLVVLALPAGRSQQSTPARARWESLGQAAASPTAADAPALASTAFVRRAVEGTGRRLELQQTLQRLGATPEAVTPQQLTQMRITDWCSLVIDSSRLRSLSPDEAEDLGRVVTALLSDPRFKKGETP